LEELLFLLEPDFFAANVARILAPPFFVVVYLSRL
jgi:hypothetical protein